MANPIQRLVRFVFDKSAANKAESDSKKSLGRIGKGFDSLKKKIGLVGAAIAAAFSVRALVNFGKESLRIATEATAIWGKLEQAVANTGIAYSEVRDEINATARAMQDATVVGDEDFAMILTELVTTSNDYAASLREVQTVADLAAAKNMDLRSAAQLVGRAMVGQTQTFARYGIIVQEGADAMEVLRHQFRGFAEAEGKTFAGQLKILNNEWADFRQAIGDVMIAAGGGTSMFETLIATLKVMTKWTNDNRMAIAKWGQVILTTVKAVAQSFVFMGRIIKNAFEAVGTTVALAMNQVRYDVGRAVNWTIEQLNKIPGVNVEFTMNEMTPQQFLNHQLQLEEELKQNAKNMGDALYDLGQAYRDVGRAAFASAQAQEAAARASGSTPTGGGLHIPEVAFRVAPDPASIEISKTLIVKAFEDFKLSLPSQIWAEFNRDMEMAKNLAMLTGQEYFTLQTEIDLLTDAMQRLLELGLDPMDRRLQGLAERLRLVQEEQDMVTRQHQIMASVANETGDVLNAAFGAGIAQLAAGKAKQNAIMAAEQAAMGLVASLNPFTAPKAAGHYAAAAQFAGIATAWTALAAATGGFSGGRGGSGVGGFSGGRGEASGRASSVGRTQNELNVYFTGEGFDAINPRVQRVVQGALQEAEASSGPNTRVRIYRNSALVQER